MKKIKVVVVVEGGVVQEVYSSDKNVEAEVVDFDNLKAEGLNADQRRQVLWREAKNCLHVVG